MRLLGTLLALFLNLFVTNRLRIPHNLYDFRSFLVYLWMFFDYRLFFRFILCHMIIVAERCREGFT